MTAIRVAHAGADYDVMIGPLAEALRSLAALADDGPVPVISDKRVFGLHGDRLANHLLSEPILVPAGEQAKTWAVLAEIIRQLAARGVKRGTPIIAFGGGSVGDVAGLAASIFKRGCPIVHIPTTLLAQADSAIGGKTAIDACGQKNLVGSFHHPSLVIADPALLGTLDERQVRSGYAEVVKYGLIDDPDFFVWCEANGAKLVQGDEPARQFAIEHCVRAKARFVAEDPDDTAGRRALLNLGHTFGHAIEALAGAAVLHGEAVAIGLALSFKFSVELGICDTGDDARVEAHLRSAGLPTAIADTGLNRRAILEAMQSDKKATASGLTLILVKGIGEAFVAREVDIERLSAFLSRTP
jgi:3-dehydroquinate synthase